MQAALRDLSIQKNNRSESFKVCTRVLHRCHEIVFGDPPDTSKSPYQSLPATPYGSTTNVVAKTQKKLDARAGNAAAQLAMNIRDRYRQQKVNPHVPPALVGLGVVLASTPGMPELAQMTGQVALAQGRRPRDDLEDTRKRIAISTDDGFDGPGTDETTLVNATRNASLSDDSDGDSSPRTRESFSRTKSSQDPTHHLRPSGTLQKSTLRTSVPTTPSHHPSHTSPSLPTKNHFENSQVLPSPTAQNSPLSLKPQSKVQRALNGSDSISRPSSRTGHTTPPVVAPFHSTPSLSNGRSDKSPLRLPLPTPESLFHLYDFNAQRALLRSHYCRSEFRFLTALEDISTRLLVIPKPARLSALRAELTGLNHSLPAEVCMPLWCPADHAHENGGERMGAALLGRKDRGPTDKVRGHHRIVRISPGDSVVLNSAQKVPYLLHLEILEDDLDFDPTRRSNRELLKKILIQEEMKKRQREGIETIEGPRAKQYGLGWPAAGHLKGTGSVDTQERRPSHGERRPSSPRRSSGPSSPIIRRGSTDSQGQGNPEEVDLIEQIFGVDYSSKTSKDRTADLADSLPVPVAPKNKVIDAAAWSRAPSLSRASSAVGPSFPTSPSAGSSAMKHAPLSDTNAPPTPFESGDSSRHLITLEDYSERMRTAAVMLAQLNASMKAEKGGGGSGHSNGPMDSQAASAARSQGPVENALDGSQPSTPVSSSARMKLDPVQATAIRDRIMREMMALEEERVSRMTAQPEGYTVQPSSSDEKSAEDESIIRRELNKDDPSAIIFKESWSAKKSRIQAASPWGHLARWNVLSVIVKTGDDLRQEQLATQLIERFGQIWKEEHCDCWVRL